MASQSTISKPQEAQLRMKLAFHARRWLREPLLHFLLAGALIFAVYDLLSPAASRPDRTNQITLTQDDLRQIAVHWLAQGRPLPTADEMRGLVQEKVREE